MKTGTSHFTGFKKALTYYKPYGYDKKSLERKILSGEISIVKPDTIGKLTVEEGRYFVEK
jgi:hypothetical protein